MAMRRLTLRSQQGAGGVSRAAKAAEAATAEVDLAAAAEGSPTGGGAASTRRGEGEGVRHRAASRDTTERRNTLYPLSPRNGAHLSRTMPSSRTDSGTTVATVAAAAEEGAINGNGSNGVENGHNAVDATKTTTGMRAFLRCCQ